MKKGNGCRRLWAFLLAVTMMMGQVLGSAQLTVHAEEGTEEEQNIFIYAEEGSDLRGSENYTWLYVGESQNFRVDVSQLELEDDYSVEWYIGENEIINNNGEFFPTDIEEPVNYEVSEEGHVITITGTAPSQSLRTEVCVKVNEEEIARTAFWFDVREEVYDYYFPVGDSVCMLPYWSQGIGRWQNCHVENPEYPYGQDVPFEVIDFIVQNEEDEVVSFWEWEDGNGWDFHVNNYGHAIGTLTYIPVNANEGETATKSFDIWASDVVYNVDAWTDTDTWQMLPGESISIIPEVWADCYNEENGHFPGDTSNVILEWTCGENDENWEEAFEISVDEATNVLTVTAKADSMDRSLQVQLKAYIRDENGELCEMVRNDWWVNSCWGYSKIVMREDVNTELAVGSETVLVPELWEYCHNEEGNQEYQITENLKYAVEFDTNAMQVTDAEGKVLCQDGNDNMGTAPFTLKKIGNWGTDVNLLAMQLNENEEWQETTRKSWFFNEQHYDIWFEELRGGDHSWIYTSAEDESQNEEYVLKLNTDNLNNKAEGSYQIAWSLGQYDEESDSHIPFENLEGAYEVSEDGSTITLYAAELRKKYNEVLGREAGDTSEIWMDIQAKVYVGENIVAQIGTGVCIRETRIEYDLPTDLAILPGWGHGINKFFSYNIENKDMPYGDGGELEILDVSVENAEDEVSEEPVAICIPWEDEGGWDINVQRLGHAVVTITFRNIDGEEATHIMHIWGSDAVYYVEADINKETWNLLPEESLEVTPRTRADFFDENGNYTEEVTDITYQWTVGANDSNYAEAFEVTENNETGVLSVKALPGAQDRSLQIELRAYVTDENGGCYEVAYNSWYINCYNSYHKMVMREEVNTQLPIGSETMLVPEVWECVYTEEGNQEYQVTENLQYIVEFDGNAFEVTDAEGKILTDVDNMGTAPFTLKKTGDWGTEVNLLAMQLDENEEWQEIVRENWYFEEQYFEVCFEELRGGDHSWIYTSAEDENQNEVYELKLNTDNLKNKEQGRYHIEWQVGYHNENFDYITIENPENAYEVSEDGSSITLYAGELRSRLNEMMGREAGDTSEIWMDIKVNVCEGDNVLYTTGMGVGIRETRKEYQLPTDFSMLPGWGNGISKYFGCYIENKDVPYGDVIELELLDISVENAENELSEEPVAVCTLWEDEEGWNIDALRFGHAIATLTFHDIDGEEVTYTIPIWGCDAIYYTNIETNTGVEQLLSGETIELTASAWADFYREDGNYTEDIEDAIFEWTWEIPTDDAHREVFDVSVDENNPKKIYITALENSNGRDMQVQLRLYCVDENGERYEVAYNDRWLYACDFYYNLQVEKPVDTELKVGQETTLIPQLWEHKLTEDGNQTQQITENLQYGVVFDEYVFQITDANGKILTSEDNMGVAPFTMKKLKNWGTDVELLAMLSDENGEYYEVFRTSWWFNEQNMHIWFEELRDDGYSWIFASGEDDGENEDYTISLNTENLDGISKDTYDIQWRIGYWMDGEFISLDVNDGAYTVNEDETSITLHSGEVRSQLRELMEIPEDENPNIWFDVEARVFVDQEEISGAGVGIEIRQPSYQMENYYGLYEFGDAMVIHDAMVFNDAKASCYVENKDYPHGEVLWFDIEEITVGNMEEQEEEVLSVDYNEAENCWIVSGDNCGRAWINYVLKYDGMGEKSFGQEIEVKEEVFRFAAWNEERTNHLLQGASIDILLEGARFFYDEEKKEVTGEVIDIKDCYFEVTNSSPDLIEIGEVENDRFTITAFEDVFGDAWFEIAFYLKENMEYQTHQSLMLNVTDCYYQAFAEEVVAEPGEKVEIPVVLRKFDLEHPNGQVMKDATYRLEGFGYEGIILDEIGTGLTITEDAATIEDETAGWYIRCIAEMDDEWGNHIFEEVGTPVYICVHNWSEVTRTEGSCTSAGTATYECAKCKVVGLHTEKTEEIAVKGHEPGEWEVVKEASCTEKGSRVKKCTVCSEVVKTEEIAALGHAYAQKFTVDKAASCTEKGSQSKHCTRTGCTAKADVTEIPMTAHTWDKGEVIVEPTISKTGVKVYVCTSCDAERKETIPMKVAGVGDTIEIKGGIYKITKTGAKNGTVSFVKPKKNAKSVVIQSIIKIKGVTYKVTAIEKNAFKNNKTVTKITVGKNVAIIGANAFYGCAKMTSIIIPSQVSKIEANVFKNCKKLKNITIQSTKLTNKNVAKNAFKGIINSATIKVPKNKVNVYKKLFKSKGLSAKVKIR